MSLESLKVLETRLDEFVDRHERVRREHEALEKRLKEKEKELAEVRGQLQGYEKERAEVRERLQHLLQRIGELELK